MLWGLRTPCFGRHALFFEKKQQQDENDGGDDCDDYDDDYSGYNNIADAHGRNKKELLTIGVNGALGAMDALFWAHLIFYERSKHNNNKTTTMAATMAAAIATITTVTMATKTIWRMRMGKKKEIINHGEGDGDDDSGYCEDNFASVPSDLLSVIFSIDTVF